jgi:hypothetical protein
MATSWQIAFRGIVSVGARPTATAMGFVLRSRGASTANPCFFAAAALAGANLSQMFAKGPYRDFTTSSDLDPSAFNCWGSVLCANAAVLVGGAIVNLNFWSVDHSPNPIPCDSTTNGLGLGGGWMPGRFICRTDTVVKAQGTGDVPTDASIVEVVEDGDDLIDQYADILADYLANNTQPDYVT